MINLRLRVINLKDNINILSEKEAKFIEYCYNQYEKYGDTAFFRPKQISLIHLLWSKHFYKKPEKFTLAARMEKKRKILAKLKIEKDDNLTMHDLLSILNKDVSSQRNRQRYVAAAFLAGKSVNRLTSAVRICDEDWLYYHDEARKDL